MNDFSWVVWLVLLALILVFETKALLDRKLGDTLSEAVWWLRVRIWGRVLVMPLWFWLTWHFFIEPRSWGAGTGVWLDDLVVVAVGFVTAAVVDYRDIGSKD